MKCGGGYRNRSTFCVYNDQRIVDNDYCDDGLKPILLEACNVNECAIQWKVGAWSDVKVEFAFELINFYFTNWNLI